MISVEATPHSRTRNTAPSGLSGLDGGTTPGDDDDVRVRGWISCLPADKALVGELGFDLTEKRTEPNEGGYETWTAEGPAEALSRLDPHFGRIIWSLEPKEGW